ncbi:MAG: oligosaccharide flippase family protein [Clostridia bacterium]|nr:oligosaccharide flippase family protein [Clostridia bacterium]
MTDKRQFFKSGAMLALTALLMRGISLLFNTYITDKVGAEGMGLLSLTMSVYAFAVTFATSGISLAVTTLVASAIGRGEGARASRVLRAAVLYALFFGGVASLALYFGSGFLSTVALGDIRTRSSLRLLSISLLPIALSAVYSGYFVAVRRVSHNALTQILEQTVRIALTLFSLTLCAEGDVEGACLALVGGSSLAELCSFFIIFLQARIDLRRHALTGGGTGGEGRAVAFFALPCAASAYARSGLVTLEHLLIPICLAGSGLSRGDALSSYAALHSMALPVLLFPTAVLAAFSGLLVPECAELAGRGEGGRVARLATRAVWGASVFALLSALLLFLCAEPLGVLLYDSTACARYIRLLAPLVPVMYLDSVVDAHLKGLGYQVYSMGINIADAALSVGAVLLLLPTLGADGYVLVIYLAEIFNFAMSLAKLRRAVGFRFPFASLAPALLAAALSLSLTPLLLPYREGVTLLVCRLAVGGGVFLLFLLFWSVLGEKTRKRRAAARS